jgi:hypothetical protein
MAFSLNPDTTPVLVPGGDRNNQILRFEDFSRSNGLADRVAAPLQAGGHGTVEAVPILLILGHLALSPLLLGMGLLSILFVPPQAAHQGTAAAAEKRAAARISVRAPAANPPAAPMAPPRRAPPRGASLGGGGVDARGVAMGSKPVVCLAQSWHSHMSRDC